MPKTIEAELDRLYADTGIDLMALPVVMTAEDLAPVLGVSVASLANDRYRRTGVPYVKMGHRVRYLRADVARYLLAQRTDTAAWTPTP